MDPSSVSVVGRASSAEDHVESMDTSESSHSRSSVPDSLEAQFVKFNEVFANRFSRLESLLAKVGSQEQVDPLVFHLPTLTSVPALGTSGAVFHAPSSTMSVGLDASFQENLYSSL